MTQPILSWRQDDVSLLYCRGQGNSERLRGPVLSSAPGRLEFGEHQAKESCTDGPLSLVRVLFKDRRMRPVTGILGGFTKFEYCADRKYLRESASDNSSTRLFPSLSASSADR